MTGYPKEAEQANKFINLSYFLIRVTRESFESSTFTAFAFIFFCLLSTYIIVIMEPILTLSILVNIYAFYTYIERTYERRQEQPTDRLNE